MRHIISVLLENEAGALSRVSGLFSARGYNIESLTVAPTNDATLSRMTIVTIGSDKVVDQIVKQLNKLIDVVRVVDLTEGAHIERELLIVKISSADASREEIKRLIDESGARILDAAETNHIVELTGTSEKLDALLSALASTDIKEVVRSGPIGIARGEDCLSL